MNQIFFQAVATAPTVYGIETRILIGEGRRCVSVATAPTVYGIETVNIRVCVGILDDAVATAPTVYGIETTC